MKKASFALFALFAICTLPLLAAKPPKGSANDYEVCYQLFEVSGVKASLDLAASSMVDEMLKSYAQMGIPNTQKIAPALKRFLATYVSYEALKDELAKLYLRNFTVAELKELIKFYKTPLGQKVAEKQPAMSLEMSKLGMRQVVEHQDDLTQMIVEAMEE